MATYYVDSRATGGTNAGTSWANAYLSIVTAAAAATTSGDVILVEYRHDETLTPVLTIGTSVYDDYRGVKVVSVDSAVSDAFRYGARLVPGTSQHVLTALMQGFNFDQSGSAATMAFGNTAFCHFDRCTFKKQSVNLVRIGGHSVTFTNCTFELGGAFTTCFRLDQVGSPCEVRVIAPTFIGTSAATSVIWSVTAGAHRVEAWLIGADISVFTQLIACSSTTAAGGVNIGFRRCRLAATMGYDGTATYLHQQGSTLLLVGCTSGTVSAPVFNVDVQYHEGYCKTVTDRYRNGGASDGTTAYGFEMRAAANRTWKQSRRASRTVELAGWVEAGAARTVTAYVAHNAVGAGTAGALTNAECWAELEAPFVGGSPTAQGYTATSMCALDGTPANLTTDGTSTWTGTSIATHQKIEFTFTPAISGQVVVRVFLAPQSASDVTVYVDPKLGVA